MPLEIRLNEKQLTQLVKDAAICAASTLLMHPETLDRGVKAAAKRIFKTLKHSTQNCGA